MPDPRKSPTHKPSRTCLNGHLYQADVAGWAWFTGKDVPAWGWRSACQQG